MKLSWIDAVLIAMGLFIAYQIIKKIVGGSWETESLIISLLIFNLGLTWRLSMNFEKHIIWHKITDKIKKSPK